MTGEPAWGPFCDCQRVPGPHHHAFGGTVPAKPARPSPTRPAVADDGWSSWIEMETVRTPTGLVWATVGAAVALVLVVVVVVVAASA